MLARAARRALFPRRPPLPLARRPLKTSTGIVGLPVDPHARDTLAALNEKLLEAVKAIPADAEYRKSVEATCNYRLKVLAEAADDDAAEEAIGLGQLEELIESQTEELDVCHMYVEHKMWETIDELNTEFKVE
mmetsp:Transcript_1717/g.5169  ORF Transcript_1717/g.5169 Transcript_1717/m.5169 type:complete len:133 (-) Transcript_1717:36-434(-)